MGNSYFYHEIEAKLYPEKLRIQDMLQTDNEHFCAISEEEFNETLNQAKSTKRKIG